MTPEQLKKASRIRIYDKKSARISDLTRTAIVDGKPKATWALWMLLIYLINRSDKKALGHKALYNQAVLIVVEGSLSAFNNCVMAMSDYGIIYYHRSQWKFTPTFSEWLNNKEPPVQEAPLTPLLEFEAKVVVKGVKIHYQDFMRFVTLISCIRSYKTDPTMRFTVGPFEFNLEESCQILDELQKQISK